MVRINLRDDQRLRHTWIVRLVFLDKGRVALSIICEGL